MSFTAEKLAKMSTNQRVDELEGFAPTRIDKLSLEEVKTKANQQSMAKEHLLAKKAQYSGMPEQETPVVEHNPDAKEELNEKRPELNLSNRLTNEKRHTATNTMAPTPSPFK